MKYHITRILAACAFCLLPSLTWATGGDFDIDRWYEILHDVQNTAIEMKISNKVINDVIQPSNFVPAIIKNDKNQSEFKLTLDQYLSRMINDKRIANGLKMRQTYPTLLSRVDKAFGVPPHIILAFWGLESNYGEFKARYKLADAFLTLIYDGRRETVFKKQLFALMKQADKSNLKIDEIHGSWAGAMGHFQFIPTTLEQYGMDGNNDGKIDIINSVGDAMYSAGNYLSKLGWNKNEKIVREVKLPEDFDTSLLDGKTKKPLTEWAAMGITNPNGTPIPRIDMIAGLVGDAAVEPVVKAYLTYPNFYRIKKWNNSNWYAIAVAELAEKLK
ncbi:MAG: lytic murein transglycosylase [Rickettsiales bacterium]|jgi:membrane-bound lytic murein transglycosylase B|nr:lytic murein transglycosylase [Rickettsiales bacterium]